MIKLNRRVVLRGWGTTQNSIGSPVASEIAAWKMWAQVEDRSGSQNNQYSQTLWQYSYKITVRYEKTRVIGSNYTVDYDGKRLVIDSCTPHSEAFRQYMVIRAHGVDDQTGTGSGGSVVPLPQIGVYDYTGIGGESDFTVGVLAGRYVFWAGKDGVGFKILRETGTPSGKEVLNVKTAGSMAWGIPFEPLEVGTVLYI